MADQFPVSSLAIDRTYGFTGETIHLVDDKTFVYACGNSVVFQDSESGTESIVWGFGTAVGAIAVHPKQRVIALAEKAIHPNIYIISYPEREVLATLRDGTELEYSSLAFSRDGKNIAALGGLPDFHLCVWNWDTMTPLMEPYEWNDLCPGNGRVNFNPFNALELCVTGGYEGVPLCHVFRLIPHANSYFVQTKALHLEAHLKDEIGYFYCHCWGTDPSVIYVGTDKGDVLQTDCSEEDGANAIVVVARRSLVTVEDDEPKQEGFDVVDLIMTTFGLLAASKDGSVRVLHVPGLEEVLKIPVLDENSEKRGILSACISPSFRALGVATEGRSIAFAPLSSITQPETEEDAMKVPEVTVKIVGDYHAGKVTGLACFPHSHRLLTAGEDGTLRSWDYRTHRLLWKKQYNVPLSALSVSDDGSQFAVGTTDGVLRIFDGTQRQGARLIHRVRLNKCQISKVSFDPLGNYIATGSADGQIFFLDGRLGEDFRVIGLVEVQNAVTSLAWNVDPDRGIYQLFAAVSPSDIFRFEPPSLEHQPDDSYRLSNADVRKALIKTESSPIAVIASNLDDGDDALDSDPTQNTTQNRQLLFALLKNRALATFAYPEETGDPELMDETDISPPIRTDTWLDKCGSCLSLSPDGSLLAIAGEDGGIGVCPSHNPSQFLSKQIHDPWSGGASFVCFSYDTSKVFSVGCDGLLCGWNLLGSVALTPATILPSSTVMRDIPAIEDFEATADEKVFLEIVAEDLQKEAKRRHAEGKKRALNDVSKLRKKLNTLLAKNEEAPDLEKLSKEEFVIDFDLRDKLTKEGDSEVSDLKTKLERENLGKELVGDRIKAECWDSMEVTGVTLKSFNSDLEVSNYPIRKMPEKEKRIDKLVSTLRKVELAEFKQRQPRDAPSLLRSAASKPVSRAVSGPSADQIHRADTNGDLDRDEDDKLRSGTPKPDDDLADLVEDTEPVEEDLLYDPFELHTPQRKITQSRLLKGKIREMRLQFNTEFEQYFTLKKDELAKIKERNGRIQQVVKELGIEEKIFDYVPDEDEHPESVLLVTADELLTAQTARGEGNEEEQEHAGDDAVQRALKQMMGGKLERRTEEQALEEEMERPEWMNKPLDQLSEEEQAGIKEFEKKEALLAEERNKRRKALETELRKLQQQIAEITAGFDDRLLELYQSRLGADELIHEQELKLVKLVQELLQQKINERKETALLARQEELNNEKTKTANRVTEFKRELERLQMQYERALREDKDLERGFKRDFLDQPESIELLHRLFRSRRRGLRSSSKAAVSHIYLADPNLNQNMDDPYAVNDVTRTVDQDPAGIDRPEGLEDSVWNRLVEARRVKMESEAEVRAVHSQLAEAEEVFRVLKSEDDNVGTAIMAIGRELNDFQKHKATEALNLVVLFKLKQGQIEVDSRKGEVVTDYADALFLKSDVVNELNKEILSLGDDKIAVMERIRNYRKAERLLKWELTKLDMEAEDLQTRIRDYHVLRVTKQLQSLIRGGTEDRQGAEVAILENRRSHSLSVHASRISEHKKQLNTLRRQIKDMQNENERLDTQVKELEMAVKEREKIYTIQRAGGGSGAGARTVKERFDGVANMRRLRDIARSQKEEIGLLKQELRRLRLRTFPTFARSGPGGPPDLNV